MVAATILKNLKSRNLDNGLNNRHEIWHASTVTQFDPYDASHS